MKEIPFLWDDTKAKANLLKHKISFNEAVSVFSKASKKEQKQYGGYLL